MLGLHSSIFSQLQHYKFTLSRSANRSATEYYGLVYQRLGFICVSLFNIVPLRVCDFLVLLWRHCSGGQSPASHLEGRVEFQVSPCRICGRRNGRHCEWSLFEYSALSLLFELVNSPHLVIVYHRHCVTSAPDSAVKLTLKIRNCTNSFLIFVFFVILLR